MEYKNQNDSEKAREVMNQLGEFKKLKWIDPGKMDEMHRTYKEDKGGKGGKADKVEKGSAWIKLYPDDLMKILQYKGLTSIKFIIAADLSRQTHNKHYYPTVVVQLQIAVGEGVTAGFVYLHFSPDSEEDICPLPEDCGLYDSI